VRIIGGRWRRSRVPVAAAEGLRPSPDRVRETLFNWLGQDLSGWRVLDAFAGSGVLGLEAASRGAAEVWLVERQPRLAASLRASCARLKASPPVQVREADGLRVLKEAAGADLDLILLDPPYDSGLLPAALDAAALSVAPGGWVYAEDRRPLTAWPPALQLVRSLKAGAVHAHLLRRLQSAEPPHA
jgi:16S rRNA (guanine(966)-N(2))-methyltransferase RsmD